MLSIKGTFQNGVAYPGETVTGRDGQTVIITFLDEPEPSAISESAWTDLAQLVESCQVHSGIGDLASQHDHYLYGTPKRED